MPRWVAELPQRARSFGTTKRVWAVVPQAGSELVELRVYQLKATFGKVATLIDVMGGKHRGVPTALLHPCAPLSQLRQGQQVLFYTWTTPGNIGQIIRLQNNAPILVRYDLAGKTTEVEVDHAESLRSGTKALAHVSFPKGGRRSVGIVVASDPQRSWVWTASGHVEIHPRSQLKPLKLANRPAIGSKVQAFTWAAGLQPGKVLKATEPALRYRVALDGNKGRPEFFFSRLFRLQP